MAIYRRKNKHQYTNVDAGIFRDQELSLKARGMLVTLLSFPDNWMFSVAGLKKIFKRDGEHSIRTGIEELERSGYLVRRQKHNPDGTFAGYEWDVYEMPQKKSIPFGDFPQTDNPQTENRSAEKPLTGNCVQSNIKGSNTNLFSMNQLSEKEHEQKVISYRAKKNAFHEFPQRDSDVEEIERALLGCR